LAWDVGSLQERGEEKARVAAAEYKTGHASAKESTKQQRNDCVGGDLAAHLGCSLVGRQLVMEAEGGWGVLSGDMLGM
jgi:hypothetical protein